MGTILGEAAPSTARKTAFATYRQAAREVFKIDPSSGPKVVSVLVDAWGIQPVMLGQKARGLDRSDIAILAKALNQDVAKALAAFDALSA